MEHLAFRPQTCLGTPQVAAGIGQFPANRQPPALPEGCTAASCPQAGGAADAASDGAAHRQRARAPTRRGSRGDGSLWHLCY